MGAKFGVAVGSDSDSSDAEFAPEDEEQDSEGAAGNTVFCYGNIVHCIAKINSGRVLNSGRVQYVLGMHQIVGVSKIF